MPSRDTTREPCRPFRRSFVYSPCNHITVINAQLEPFEMRSKPLARTRQKRGKTPEDGKFLTCFVATLSFRDGISAIATRDAAFMNTRPLRGRLIT